MRRRTFDLLASGVGAVIVIALVAAGSLGLWASSYSSSNVHNQLAAQHITFPTAAVLAHPTGKEITASMQQYLGPYAGKQLLTGDEAAAYADHFIAVHLSEMPYKGVYSAVSAASMAQPNNTALAAEVQTVFRGTTLRSMLLEAYGFSVFGEIALVAAIVSFILAAVMLVLTVLGVWHFSRTPEDVEFPKSLHKEVRVPAGV